MRRFPHHPHSHDCAPARRDANTPLLRRGAAGFLFSNFKPEFAAWEMFVVIGRKIGLVGVAVAIEPLGVSAQVLFALLLMHIASLLHATCEPYALPRLNRVEFWALNTALLSLWLGCFLVPELSPSSTMSQTISVVVVVSNIGLFAYILWTGVQSHPGEVPPATLSGNDGSARTTRATPSTTLSLSFTNPMSRRSGSGLEKLEMQEIMPKPSSKRDGW